MLITEPIRRPCEGSWSTLSPWAESAVATLRSSSRHCTKTMALAFNQDQPMPSHAACLVATHLPKIPDKAPSAPVP